ncbi:redoxin domain-containing protein [Lysobacter sp. MMG2]|uniref:redoxin domain-containing protein n=1 Tax=Lysobacter sp. MMG2 TaxID=2801338 RepID=UPI001C241036|nr:redoxin domain-containing protein [Lysobacter sp. MMG2]MBU8978051.1 redoxin domain-containing protein [Lysobacter sp. MMG2]
MNAPLSLAPALQVERWFNTDAPITLESLRGKVVVLEAFQMLCPGCVSHGLPQAQRVAQTFSSEQVAVIGLHTVFEHHEAMTPVSLQAFLHEYRIAFPVGVDLPGTDGPIPRTMRAYAMRGTPTMTLIDAQGRIRHQHFGQVSDLVLGAQIASLIGEAAATRTPETAPAAACDANGCTV